MISQLNNSRLGKAIRGFHDDEAGIEAIQVVMILAIAAVALILIKSKWQAISNFFTSNTDQAIQWGSAAGGAGAAGPAG